MAKIDQIVINDTTYEIVPEIAPLFNTSTVYNIGDYVIKDAVLYRFISAHAAGNWNSNEVEEFESGEKLAAIDNQITDIKQDFSELESSLHSISKTESVDITPTTNNKLIKNSDGTILDAGSVSFYISKELNVTEGEKYKISLMMRFNNAVVAFYDADGTFTSSIPANKGTASENNYTFTDYEFTVPANATKMRIGFYTYKFTVQKVYEVFSSHPSWYGKNGLAQVTH